MAYLATLKIENIQVLRHPRKTFALGFITNINSIKILSNRLLNSLQFKYILTYKFSQDHLELLFSCVRSRGGHNNNPNVKPVSYTHLDVYKRQIVEFSRPIVFGEDRLRERGSLLATVFYQGNFFLW